WRALHRQTGDDRVGRAEEIDLVESGAAAAVGRVVAAHRLEEVIDIVGAEELVAEGAAESALDVDQRIGAALTVPRCVRRYARVRAVGWVDDGPALRVFVRRLGKIADGTAFQRVVACVPAQEIAPAIS